MLSRIHTPSEDLGHKTITKDYTGSLISKCLADKALLDLYRQSRKWFEYLIMRYLLEMTYEEIGKADDTSTFAVEQSIYAAKTYLKRKYSGMNPDTTYAVLAIVLKLALYDAKFQ